MYRNENNGKNKYKTTETSSLMRYIDETVKKCIYLN